MTIQHMVDLETMSTEPNAIVLTIGVVAFDTQDWTIVDKFYCALDYEHQDRQHRRHVSADTMAWWKTQPVAAYMAAFQSPSRRADLALPGLSAFMVDTQGVWGNGASFDNVILSTLYADYGIERPWKFWHDRCFRTIKHIGKQYPMTMPEFKGTPHNALDDAVHQFECLRTIAFELELDIG